MENKLTLKEALELAYTKAVDLWADEYEIRLKNPKSVVANAREEAAWDRAESIKELIRLYA